MSRSDGGSRIAVGMESSNLHERARFYADRNQIETAVFFAGNCCSRSRPPPPPSTGCILLDTLSSERLVAASGPNQLDDVIFCASLLQRADQHFRAVSLLTRFPDAASCARGKIVLAQSHAALGDWDMVKVVALRQFSCLVLTLCLRLYWSISVMLAPSVFYYQVSSAACVPNNVNLLFTVSLRRHSS